TTKTRRHEEGISRFARKRTFVPTSCPSCLRGSKFLTSTPRQRVRLDVRKTLHRLEHAFLVAEAGILDAAEGRHLDAVAGNLPDIDRADLQLVDEAGDVVEAVGADAG